MNLNKIKSLKYLIEIAGKIAPSKERIKKLLPARVLIIYAVFFVLMTGYSVYRQLTAPEDIAVDKKPETVVQVKVFKVKRGSFSDTMSVMGTVKGASEVKLKFEISGKLSTFNFREGDQVSEGDVIASLDASDLMTRLRHSKSKLESVVSKYNAAREKLDVYRELYEMGAIIRAKMKEMELSLESIKSEVDAAESEVKLARSHLDKTVIKAPSNGVMGTRFAEPGDFVTPNDVVGNFLEVKNVFVELGVIEKDIEKIAVGQKVKVKVDAYPDEVFWGTVDNVSKMVRGETRTLPVRVKLSNPRQRLYSGMLAECEIYLNEFEDTIMIPTSCVIDLGEMTVVPLVKPSGEDNKEGVVEIRKIEISSANEKKTFLKDGLSENDLVVSETRQPLKDQMKVKIIEVIESN